MTLPKPRAAIYADIEALPPHIVGEIIFGALHAHPRPSPRHARATGEVFGALRDPFDRGRGGPGGRTFLIEPELHLGSHIVVPDLAGWKRERLTPFPATAYIDTPPDWVCEVLSPSTSRIDRTDKLAIYAAFEVGHVWLVDPDARTLEALALTSGKWLITASLKDADAVTAPPFESHTFPLDNLWPVEG